MVPTLEDAVSNLEVSSDRLVELLTPALREDDADALDRMQSLLYGNLAAMDALNTAAEEPAYIASSLRVRTILEFPIDSWYADVELATAGLNGVQTLGGGATAPPDVALQAAITKLSDAAGSEVVAISTDAAVMVARPLAGHLIGGLVTDVLSGSAGHYVRSAAQSIRGVFVAAKRAAGRVVAWVVDHAKDVLPSALANLVPSVINTVSQAVFQNALPRFVGGLAADLLGKNDVLTAWANAEAPIIQQALAGLDLATADGLRRIQVVSRCRGFFDKWLRWLIGPASTAPPVAIGVAVVALATALFVFGQLWSGLGGLNKLVL